MNEENIFYVAFFLNYFWNKNIVFLFFDFSKYIKGTEI